jgi:hypothetical protein
MNYPQLFCQGLELAIAVHYTDRAGVVALCQQQFDDHTTSIQNAFGIRTDHHSLFCRGGTGGCRARTPLNLYDTDPTGSHWRKARKMTQGGNGYPVLIGHLKQALSDVPRDDAVIDC